MRFTVKLGFLLKQSAQTEFKFSGLDSTLKISPLPVFCKTERTTNDERLRAVAYGKCIRKWHQDFDSLLTLD